MWRLTLTGVVMLAGLGLAAPGPKDPPKPSFVGTWRLVSVDGRDSIPATYVFWADGTLAAWYDFGVEVGWSGRYTIDPKAGHLDLIRVEGEPPAACLYRLTGDRLSICCRKDGDGRPAAFGEAGTVRQEWERVKPKD